MDNILTDNVKMDRIPTNVKYMPFLYWQIFIYKA